MKKPLKPQGQTAGFTGRQAEASLTHYLESSGYLRLDGKQCKLLRRWVRSLRRPADWFPKYAGVDSAFVKSEPVAKNIYGLDWKVDFCIWHRILWPQTLLVECKSQAVSGSVDEKLPFIVLSLKMNPCPSAALLIGSGARNAAIEWVERQVDHERPNPFYLFREVVDLRNFIEGRPQRIVKPIRTIIKTDQSELFSAED